MKKYYNLPSNDEVHIVIQNKGYGKTYHEINRIKNKLKKDKIEFVKDMKQMEFIENTDCIVYNYYKYLINYIDNLYMFIEERNKHE